MDIPEEIKESDEEEQSFSDVYALGREVSKEHDKIDSSHPFLPHVLNTDPRSVFFFLTAHNPSARTR